jgi:hypothetical protein
LNGGRRERPAKLLPILRGTKSVSGPSDVFKKVLDEDFGRLGDETPDLATLLLRSEQVKSANTVQRSVKLVELPGIRPDIIGISRLQFIQCARDVVKLENLHVCGLQPAYREIRNTGSGTSTNHRALHQPCRLLRFRAVAPRLCASAVKHMLT